MSNKNDTTDIKGLESPASSEPPSSTEVIKQLHETCRHAFGLFVGWFTFFITLNFVALGWLAKVGTEKPNPLIVKNIVLALILFIGLGILSGVTVVVQVRRTRALLIGELMTTANSESIVRNSLPANLYTFNVVLMIIALLILVYFWINFWTNFL